MKHRARVRFILTLALAGFGLAGAYSLLNRTGRRAVRPYVVAEVPVVPRTVTLLERSADSTGAVVMGRITRAVRADGSQVKIDEPLSGAGNVSREYMFRNRLIVRTSELAGAKTSRRAEAAAFEAHVLGSRDARADCVGTMDGHDLRQYVGDQVVGIEPIGGIRAVKIVNTKAGPKITTWFAPDYACEVVRQEIEYRHGDTTGTSVKTLEYARKGEPDGRLFEIPPGLTEVPPSELQLRVAERLTGRRELCNRQEVEAADLKYYAQRP